jgi:hypothetical protein
VEQLVNSLKEYQGILTAYQAEVCNCIPDLWRSWVKQETCAFSEYSFFYNKLHGLSQPNPWEGDRDEIEHLLNQDKQVITYTAKLEKHHGHHVAPAYEVPDDSNGSSDNEDNELE